MYKQSSSKVAESARNETGILSVLGLNPPGALQRNSGVSTPLCLSGDEQLRLSWIEPCQAYDFYAESDHEAWRRLLARMGSRWERYAPEHFKEGLTLLDLDPTAIPHLEDIDRRLGALTNFRTIPVRGFIPAVLFFKCLAAREFPTTTKIRPLAQLDFLPEPDIFHDSLGHLPFLTDPDFANTLVQFGKCASTAVEATSHIKDDRLRIRSLGSMLRALARFFWFTVEVGLIKSNKGLRVYGGALMSSFGEIAHAIDSEEVERCPLEIDRVVNQTFDYTGYQPLVFYVESFAHLFDLVSQFDESLRNGKFTNVADGEPTISHEDIASFFEGPRSLITPLDVEESRPAA
jgi:phenylalanine-4-hydroxylase